LVEVLQTISLALDLIRLLIPSIAPLDEWLMQIAADASKWSPIVWLTLYITVCYDSARFETDVLPDSGVRAV